MRTAAVCLIGFMSGVVISGGVFAFLVIIGIVPRMLQKTKTAAHILLYETVMSLGGVGGALALLAKGSLHLNSLWTMVPGLCYGIFVGCLAISTAEILNVIPILGRRLKITRALTWVMTVLACGKAIGTLIQFFVPGLLRIK